MNSPGKETKQSDDQPRLNNFNLNLILTSYIYMCLKRVVDTNECFVFFSLVCEILASVRDCRLIMI